MITRQTDFPTLNRESLVTLHPLPDQLGPILWDI